MSMLNNSEAELAAIKEVNKHLHNQVKELRTESNELSKQNKALVNHNFLLRTENDGLHVEIKILHTTLNGVKQNIDTLEDLIYELRAEIKNHGA